MKYDPAIHHRKSIRLKGYDYAQSGAYFVTIVTHGRECLFGEIVNGEMQLNAAGKIVQWEWERLAQRFKFLEFGAFVVMPNHAHAIIIIHSHVGATRAGLTSAPSGAQPLRTDIPEGNDGSPLPPTGPAPSSLGAIIAQFKSRVTKRLWKIPTLAGTPIWQRNYYEHIIRNDDDANRIYNYIQSNPSMWDEDEENPTKRR
jgi:REP element-mobilizing transposase RayT